MSEMAQKIENDISKMIVDAAIEVHREFGAEWVWAN
jgi:hypothetical protein